MNIPLEGSSFVLGGRTVIACLKSREDFKPSPPHADSDAPLNGQVKWVGTIGDTKVGYYDLLMDDDWWVSRKGGNSDEEGYIWIKDLLWNLPSYGRWRCDVPNKSNMPKSIEDKQ